MSQILSPSLTSLIQKHNLNISIGDIKSVIASWRFDADFYMEIKHRSDKKSFSLEELTTRVTSGHTPYKHNLEEGEIGFITIESVEPLNFNNSKTRKILKTQYNKEFLTNRTVKGSIICTIKRRICNAYPILSEQDEGLAFNQDIAFLMPKDPLSTAYIATYLSSKIWKDLAKKFGTEQMNPYLSVSNLKKIPIILPSSSFQSSITSLVQEAYRQRELSKSLYSWAEQLLLSELGLTGWKPTDANIDIKTSEEVRLFGRCDAEFFQPRYDELFARLSKFEVEELGDIVDYTKGVEPVNWRKLEYWNQERYDDFKSEHGCDVACLFFLSSECYAYYSLYFGK